MDLVTADAGDISAALVDAMDDQEDGNGDDNGYPSYCSFLSSLTSECLRASILDLWDFDRSKISNLTRQKVLDDINSAARSPTFGFDFDFSTLLGGVQRDADGNVVSARAAASVFTLQVKSGEEEKGDHDDKADTVTWVAHGMAPVSRDVLRWEKRFVNTLQKLDLDSMEVFFKAERR